MDFEKLLQRPDYGTPNKKKHYVESESRRMAGLLEEVTGESENALMYGPFMIRRQKAVLGILDKAEAEFKNCFSPVESLTRYEFSPINTYNSLDRENDFEIGAAIWILETLRKTDHFLDAIKLLPDMIGNYDDWYVPMDFSYPSFSIELFRSVIYMIKNRHGENTEILCEANAEGEPASDVFRQIMEMLPKKEVERACAAFKEKQWELITRYMKCRAYYDREVERVVRNIRQQTSPLFMKKDEAPDPEEVEQLIKKKQMLPMDFDKYFDMERRAIIRETGSRDIADAVSRFRIEDPYDICFALFYLLESGDDAPWLVESGSCLCLMAMKMLPWYTNNENWEQADWDEYFDEYEYNRKGWLQQDPPEEQLDFFHTKHNGKNLAQVIYGLCRSVVPMGKHPFEADRKELISEGMDEDTARNVTVIAEMLFLHEFQAQSYKPMHFDWEDEEEEESKTAEEEETTPLPITAKGYWGRTLGIEEEPEDPKLTAYKDESAELEKAKKEIKALKEALSMERREADNDRVKYERELKTLRLEHRELADLRTLVFNQQSTDPTRLEKTTQQISYPYSTKKRTVVFGGHDSFLRAFKPLLPDVKFVDTEQYGFAPEIVRNADVVWVQTNCISHSQYNNITRVVRQYGIQLRYFGYASAEKCAEQLVMEDRK